VKCIPAVLKSLKQYNDDLFIMASFLNKQLTKIVLSAEEEFKRFLAL